MNKMIMNVNDLNIITAIVKENNIESFHLIQHNSSGIGYTIDLEFETEIKGRDAIIRIPVCTSDNW